MILQRLMRNRRGNALVTALIAAGIISGVGVVMVNRSTANVRQMQLSAEADQSWYLAMAGIEECLARVRWESGVFANLESSPISCTGALSGGTYSAAATHVSSTTGRILSTGTHGRFARTLIGVFQWQNEEGAPGSMSLYGGGNWRFSGNSHIEGNIASRGDIYFEGSSTLCGQAHAGGIITPDGSDLTAHLKPGCSSVTVEKSNFIMTYSDDWDGPYDRTVTGNYTITDADAVGTNPWTYMYVDGTVTFPNKGGSDWVFSRTIKIVAKNGFIINDGLSGAPGEWVYLYSMADYGGTITPCQDLTGTAKAGDVGTKLTAFIDQSEHHDIVLWAPNGMVYFKGSQGGGSTAGVYGKVYAKCVQTADNWNFYPGSDLPGGSCQVGCASSLRLTALYEQQN